MSVKKGPRYPLKPLRFVAVGCCCTTIVIIHNLLYGIGVQRTVTHLINKSSSDHETEYSNLNGTSPIDNYAGDNYSYEDEDENVKAYVNEEQDLFEDAQVEPDVNEDENVEVADYNEDTIAVVNANIDDVNAEADGNDDEDVKQSLKDDEDKNEEQGFIGEDQEQRDEEEDESAQVGVNEDEYVEVGGNEDEDQSVEQDVTEDEDTKQDVKENKGAKDDEDEDKNEEQGFIGEAQEQRDVYEEEDENEQVGVNEDEDVEVGGNEDEGQSVEQDVTEDEDTKQDVKENEDAKQDAKGNEGAKQDATEDRDAKQDAEGNKDAEQDAKQDATEDKGAKQDVNGNKDYCSSDGNVCAYHNICYDTAKKSWYTASDPIPKTTGHPLLNDMNYDQPANSRKEKASKCNEHFEPESNVPYPNEDDMIYEEGTTYFVCCWVNHFGHILLQMMVSAVHAIDKIGLGDYFKTNKMSFLVDNRAVLAGANGSGDIVMNVFNFLTGRSNTNSVISLQDLESESRQLEKGNICFEKLVVGMLYDNLVHGERHGTGQKTFLPGAEVGMLDLLRDHVKNRYPLTKQSRLSALTETLFKPDDEENSDNAVELSTSIRESPPECTITYLRRKFATRVISNFDEVMDATENIFNEDKWNIRTVSFDGPSMESQFLTVQSSMVFISVSGTGSHMGMFLPDGGTSIEILFNNISVVKNKYICQVSPNMSCLAVMSNCKEKNHQICKKATNTEVNIESLKEALESVKIDISDKCDAAMKSSAGITSEKL